MSTLIIAGEPGAREKRIRMIWSRTNGYSYSRIWWGPYDDVRALLTTFTDGKSGVLIGAESFEMTPQDGSPIGILTVNYSGHPTGGGGGNEGASEVVSIAFTNETLKINRHPSFVGISNEDIQRMEKKIALYEANTETAGSAEFGYYDERMAEVSEYEVDLPYVTWTRTVPPTYPTALDLANVGGIFTTANLAGSIGAPILFTIPTGNIGIATGGGFTAGWKKGGSVDFQGDGKAQLVLTAKYGLWSNRLYTLA